MNGALEQVNKINARLVARYGEEMRKYEALRKRDALKPKKIRLRIGDVSIEAVHDILKDTHTGLLLVRDELSGWLGGMDAYAHTGKGGGKRDGFMVAPGKMRLISIRVGTCSISRATSDAINTRTALVIVGADGSNAGLLMEPQNRVPLVKSTEGLHCEQNGNGACYVNYERCPP